MAKIILYDDEARSKLLSGSEKLSKTVGVTMGPKGKNVIIGKFVGAPVITKDGVTVAREMSLEDPIEELACLLIKEVAGRTADVAGDGTTTATVLADEILKNGTKLLSTGYSPLDFRNGVDLAKELLFNNINKLSKHISSEEELLNIATISANNDTDLGEKIAEAYKYAGLEGTVGLEGNAGNENFVKKIEGLELESGYITPHFITKQGKKDVIFENCKILIADCDITHIDNCIEFFNEIHTKNIPLLVIARDLRQEALATLVTNNKLGKLRVVGVKMPAKFHDPDWLNDLGALTGASVIGQRFGRPINDLSTNDLGFAKRVIVNKYKTKIFDADKNQEMVNERLSIYSKDLNESIGDKARRELENRVRLLKSKAAILSVGYSTELELREKGDRAEDALYATKAAIKDGIVPGGGITLLRAASMVNRREIPEHLLAAVNVILNSCSRPIRQIVLNAGANPEKVIKKVLNNKNNNYGYNAAINKFEDLMKSGVIDPKKVTITALENAISVSLLLINTDAVVAEKPDDPSSWQPPAGWRPPEQGKLNHKY